MFGNKKEEFEKMVEKGHWEKLEKTQKEEEQDWLLLMQINRAETWFLNG